MNGLQGMDRYLKEVIQVRTYNECYTGSVYLYNSTAIQPSVLTTGPCLHICLVAVLSEVSFLKHSYKLQAKWL